ncbi:MAG: DUF421 domain-containing protein [Oscillospiraceae bacterium]|jgi:uncharacterized membrane protein YcaP (DUF421 family)|nr:DUF421 domain-containing protein [Oscillospiraceae bacterium]
MPVILIRTLLLYALVIFAVRLMGKKQIGELQPTELVTAILISNIATLALEDPDLPMLSGVIPILAIVCLDIFMTVFSLKSDKFRRILTGNPRVIIRDGVINQREMKNLRYTIHDLTEAARDAGIFDISKVRYAVAETTGKINFYEAPDKSSTMTNPPVLAVSDGTANKSALGEAGLDEKWLSKILAEKNIPISRVFMLTADENGNYCLIEKNM